MPILGGLVVLGFIVWGLVWVVSNFWPLVLAVAAVWFLLWFLWPGFKLRVELMFIRWKTALAQEDINEAVRRGKKQMDQVKQGANNGMVQHTRKSPGLLEARAGS